MQKFKLNLKREQYCDIAHNINNPLTISMSTVSILKDITTDPDVFRYLETIETANKRMSEYVKSLKEDR